MKFCDQNGADAFKIHTSDLGNKGLLEAARNTKKRIDLSVGGSSISEISKALKIIGTKTKVWLMYGMQLFPLTQNIIFEKMKTLKKKFKREIGYQDHSPPGISAFSIPAVALGYGINIIEKHITDDRKERELIQKLHLNLKNFSNLYICVKILVIL